MLMHRYVYMCVLQEFMVIDIGMLSSVLFVSIHCLVVRRTASDGVCRERKA